MIGCLLYYARAIDSSFLVALNIVAQSQEAPTTYTLTYCCYMLDYCATFPNSEVRYNASNKILYNDPDMAYLVTPRAKSLVAGHFQLNNLTSTKKNTPLNGSILVECKTL